ncbi:diguanylate cyclase (GGDEF) domain-containing protein [Modicisalibacter muralis]|uniref:diguanylate cyclase n=1 Tax=Modicisalibacter muralis TaxID=119000 RepID=A0A1G9FGY9_9GAMM|nr:diguanylate cyclase [Halomonas muralis]SDK87695.1 diguanylate cyclase (GGDEF) domain-containing protein [Halomonas muralis]
MFTVFRALFMPLWRPMCFWLLASVATSIQAASPQVFPQSVDIAQLEHRLLRAPATFLITDTRTELDEVKQRAFMPLTDEHINHGISAKTYWLRVRLENTSPIHDRAWVLHHESSYLDNFTIYYADTGEPMRKVALTDRQPFHSRPVDYRKLAFSHVTPAGESTDVYLRLDYDKADSVSLNVHLWERDDFERYVRWENLLHGGYFGIILTLVCIALLFAIAMRELTFLYYCAFLVTSGLTWALISGLAYQYFWPDSVFWHNEGFHIVYLLFVISAFQFSRAFLHTAKYFPRCNKLMRTLQFIMAFAILLRFFGDYELVLDMAFAAMASTLILLPALGWRAYRKGVVYARWFAAAWLIYSLGLVISLASAYTRVFDWGMESLVYTQIGGLIESLLLLVALAERLMAREADRRQAIRLANQDPLTQLGNRRLMAQQYEVVRERFARTQVPVFLIMLDLDHFKAINDAYGHIAGDSILQHLADVLRSYCREEDVCIRLGGEEFAMLLQVPNESTALKTAERIRQEFSNTPTFYQGHAIAHTLSIGLSPALTTSEQLTLQEAMVRADEALYRAKTTSRNCTAVYAA